MTPGLESAASTQDQDGDQLLHTLRRMAAAGQASGPERALASRFGVTRHRLRKALSALRADGVIAPPARRRTAVTAPGEAMVRATNPVEVIELRMLLEPSLARLAALRAPPLSIARIERAATTLTEMEPGAADLTFHKLVAAASGNVLAAEFYALLRRVGTDVRLRLASKDPVCPHRLRERDAEHRAIADAIAARDADAAEAAMTRHLRLVQQQILNRLTARAGAP